VKGTHILRDRQSSDVGPEMRNSCASILYVDGIRDAYCGHDGPNLVASILPTGDFATGGAHRRVPTAGSA
jgi:hypothetical protein